jgi:chromosome segregation ATPase
MSDYIDAETFEKSSNEAVAQLHETIIALKARIYTLEKDIKQRKKDLIKEKNEVKSQRQAFENGLKLLNSNNQELLILRKEVEYYEENIDLVWKRRIRPEKLIQEKEEKIKLKRSIARGWQSTLVQIQKIYDTERQKYRDLSNKYDELKDDNENMPVPQGIKKEIDDRVTQLQNELNIAKEDIEFLKRKLNNNSLWEQRLKETGRQVRKSLRDYIVPPKN